MLLAAFLILCGLTWAASETLEARAQDHKTISEPSAPTPIDRGIKHARRYD